MDKYIVDLNPSDTDEEDFELENENVGEVRVYKNGKNISSDCRVLVQLSKDGLIGLGTELIRLGHSFKNGRHSHIYPVDPDLVSQSMGIFLTANSCELILVCHDFGSIDKHIEKK
ncbi:hypothetical protein [Numidum massiliense]|uniref:hypothetical protein n=1 Tax=Numidum massiliense TaxID=1522315 RepID=UPI0006D585D5|nr:hypothetical protein [Numidum massiliense]